MQACGAAARDDSLCDAQRQRRAAETGSTKLIIATHQVPAEEANLDEVAAEMCTRHALEDLDAVRRIPLNTAKLAVLFRGSGRS